MASTSPPRTRKTVKFRMLQHRAVTFNAAAVVAMTIVLVFYNNHTVEESSSVPSIITSTYFIGRQNRHTHEDIHYDDAQFASKRGLGRMGMMKRKASVSSTKLSKSTSKSILSLSDTSSLQCTPLSGPITPAPTRSKMGMMMMKKKKKTSKSSEDIPMNKPLPTIAPSLYTDSPLSTKGKMGMRMKKKIKPAATTLRPTTLSGGTGMGMKKKKKKKGAITADLTDTKGILIDPAVQLTKSGNGGMTKKKYAMTTSERQRFLQSSQNESVLRRKRILGMMKKNKKKTARLTLTPTFFCSNFPSLAPTSFADGSAAQTPKTTPPTLRPTNIPTTSPSFRPSRSIADLPTTVPYHNPSSSIGPTPGISPGPTVEPIRQPTSQPTERPSHLPSIVPTSSHPSSDEPTHLPTGKTEQPSSLPSEIPTISPTLPDRPTDPPTATPMGSPTTSSSAQPTSCSIDGADTSLVCGFTNTLFWFPPIQQDTNAGTLATTEPSSCCNNTFPKVQDLRMNYKFARYFPAFTPGPTGRMVGWDGTGECATWVADLGPAFGSISCLPGSFILSAYELNTFDPSNMEFGYLGSTILDSQVTEFSFFVPSGLKYQPVLLAGFPEPTPINCSPLITFFRNVEGDSTCVDVNIFLEI